MLSRPGGSFCVFIEKLPLARNQVPIAIYHLLTEVKAKRKLSFIIWKRQQILLEICSKNVAVDETIEEKVSILLSPCYSEFHTDRSPEALDSDTACINFEELFNFLSLGFVCTAHSMSQIFEPNVTITKTFCLFVLRLSYFVLQFVRPDVKTAQVWLYLPPAFAKLSPTNVL